MGNQFSVRRYQILEGGDAAYFPVMATIWSNFDLQAQQLITAAFAIRNLQQGEEQFGGESGVRLGLP
jgi:hypothetical protein